MKSRVRLLFGSTMSLLVGLASPSRGEDKPAELTKTTELTVSPKASPVPAYRYRVFPRESERTPGNAVPIYLRVTLGHKDAEIDLINEKTNLWLDGPMEKMPVDQARKLVNRWGRSLKQLDYGARRKTAEWDYTIPEQKEEVIEILLPDMQPLRTWSRLLALRAHLEIAEKKYDDAINTIETGLSLGRHVAEGPFLINGLVGIAIENIFLNRVEDLIAQPDAPNLYWALSALPRPLVDLRKELDMEYKVGEYMLPEITDTETPRTDAEWASLLARLHRRWNRVAKNLVAGENPINSASLVDPDFKKFEAGYLSRAKDLVKLRRGSIEGMNPAQIIVLYVAETYRELRDAVFQPAYLSYAEARPVYEAAERRLAETKGGVEGFFAAILPAISSARWAEARLDRRLAALRVIEALRLQAASEEGTLPASLDQVTAAPIPLDPETGRAFGYRREGDSAILDAPSTKRGRPGLSYRITLRK